jgi:hypothetical protein
MPSHSVWIEPDSDLPLQKPHCQLGVLQAPVPEPFVESFETTKKGCGPTCVRKSHVVEALNEAILVSFGIVATGINPPYVSRQWESRGARYRSDHDFLSALQMGVPVTED